MLDIDIKQFIRDYFDLKMAKSRQESRIFGHYPALLIRDGSEYEEFVDGLWLFIQQQVIKKEQEANK